MMNALAADVIAALKDEADPEAQEAMLTQYGIHADNMYGVPMRRLLEIAKPLSPDLGAHAPSLPPAN